MQLYISVFVPFFTLLLIFVATTLSNRAAVNDLRAEMRAGFEALGKRMEALDARMDRIETRMDRIEGKLDRLTEEVYKLHESRISRLEERVFGRTA